MISADNIRDAKRNIRNTGNNKHEHDDCVRIAYEWLDAQTKIKRPNQGIKDPLKHLIERWAGRYVSEHDVEAAAYLHPEIHGHYPYYNINSRLVEPTVERLKSIGEANTQKKL